MGVVKSSPLFPYFRPNDLGECGGKRGFREKGRIGGSTGLVRRGGVGGGLLPFGRAIVRLGLGLVVGRAVC